MSELQLPTEQELTKLTPRAMVAYACRAARRVQPLCRGESQNDEIVRAIENGIAVAELFATSAANYRNTAAKHAVDDLRSHFTTINDNFAQATVHSVVWSKVAESAFNAVEAAHLATSREDAIGVAQSAFRSAYVAEDVADDVTEAIAPSVPWAEDLTVRAAVADYVQLLRVATSDAKDPHGAPIDFSALGPLWPDGEPEWYRNPDARPIELMEVTDTEGKVTGQIKFYGPLPSEEIDLNEIGMPAVGGPDNTPAFVIAWSPEFIDEDEYARLTSLLGDLVRAEGGAGIRRLKSKGFGVPVAEGVLQ